MTTQEITFKHNIELLNSLGFNFNHALNMIKRINKHISFCIDNNQDYEETVFYIEQDVSFEKSDMESLICNCILSNESWEKYYNGKI